MPRSYEQQIDQRQGTTRVTLGMNEYTPEALIRYSRLGRELRLLDQILANDMDTLTITDTGPAPAWTNLEGDHVSFAAKRMPGLLLPKDVAVWLGTNAHELGHVLYSPRRESTLMRRVIECDKMLMPALMQLHNIVEDQREERLLLAKFSPWTAYLVAALGYHLKVDEDSAWLLLAGRTWLPDNVRALARARFVKRQDEATTQKVTMIVGQYQRLTDPGESEATFAFKLLSDLHDLVGDDVTPRHMCGVMSGGYPDTNDPDADAVPATADEAGEPSEGGGEPGEGKAGESGQAPGGTGAGNTRGKPTGKVNSEADIEKAIKKALDKVAKEKIEEPETKGDLQSVLDALDYGRPGGSVEGLAPVGRYEPASDTARRLHYEVADALLDLKDASEPGWVRKTDSGRLNVRRLVNPNVDADELFDRYEPGQMDASELEAVLLVDVSGSMSRFTRKLGEATWAIRQSVDDLDGRITVLAYETGPHQVWCEPGVRPDDKMFIPESLGGTEPKSALREAWGILADSQARNRLLIILTDGSWFSSEGDKVIKAMNNLGITTVLAMLAHRYSDEPTGVADLDEKLRHGCQYGAQINDPFELARLFKRVASDRIGAWL